MLEKLDLTLSLGEKDYEKELLDVQLTLVKLQQRMRAAELPVVMIYEGCDAGGKGGSILRLTEKLDPRGYSVCPIAAPNEVERQYNYLWRFWTRLPAKGQLVVFDRSWYGRVLVERVEEFAKPEEWKRAYGEINNFEQMLSDNGMVVLKFWLQISKHEQLKRFKDRESDPFKQWKIGAEDWRNRERWDDYQKAAEDMFAETDTKFAPWHIIPAECKRYARVEVARTVAKRIEAALA